MAGHSTFEGVNSDEGVSSTQLRLVRILVHQLLRTAFLMESNGFHGGSLADCTSILSVPSAHAFEKLVDRSWFRRVVIFARSTKARG